MAYNNGFPINYQYYQQPMMQQPVQMMPQPMPQQMPMQQAATQAQMQQQQQYPVVHGGFVRVRNENEARTYFVSPGNSVTFINEDSTYVYTKTVEMNQLDRPKFEKYRLVKEDDDAPEPVEAPQKAPVVPAEDLSKFATKTDFEAFKAELDAIRADVDTFRGDLYGIAGKKASVRKKEAVTDD